MRPLLARYFLKSATEATSQHFSLSSNDNNHVHVTGLTEGKWSELTLNFSRDADNRHVRMTNLKQDEWTFVHVDFTKDGRRNEGKEAPFAAGHQVDDLFFLLDENDAELYVDEVTLYDAGKP
jgi:hypothetical protein